MYQAHKFVALNNRRSIREANFVSEEAHPTTPAEYPTVDIRPWMHPSSSTVGERAEVVRQVVQEARGAGSFNIVGHDVNVDTIDRLELSSSKFFTQSRQQKESYSINSKDLGGYLRKGLRETFIHSRFADERVRAPDYFRVDLEEYSNQMRLVEIALTNIFEEAFRKTLGIEIGDSHSPGLLKVNRYPASLAQQSSQGDRFASHTDFSTLTLIYGNSKGLEEIRDGRFVEVPMPKGQIHCALGGIYSYWSDGCFTNNIHRVSNRSDDNEKDRISFAYFCGQG